MAVVISRKAQCEADRVPKASVHSIYSRFASISKRGSDVNVARAGEIAYRRLTTLKHGESAARKVFVHRAGCRRR
jgi:hypothetical protein